MPKDPPRKVDEEYKKKFTAVRQVTGNSEVSFAAATKNAIDGLYDLYDNDKDGEKPPTSFEVVQLGGTISPNPGKINYAATLNVTIGGGS